MKTKYLAVGLAAILAIAGAWFARAAWTKLAPNDNAFEKFGPPDENADFKGSPPTEAPPKFFVNAPTLETGHREGPPGPPLEGGGFGGRMMVGRTANGETVIKNG